MKDTEKIIIVPPGGTSRHIYFDELPGGSGWFGNRIKMAYYSNLLPGYLVSSIPEAHKAIMLVSGELNYDFNHRAGVARAGDALVLPGGFYHRISASVPVEMLLWVIFPDSPGFAEPEFRHFSLPSIPLFRLLMEQAFDESRQAEPDESICRALAEYILALLRRALFNRNTVHDRKHQRVNQLIMELKRNPEAVWTVERMAEVVGCSVPALFLLVRKYCDTTPGELARSIRMEYAARLLAIGDFSVKEIAGMCGYELEFSFSRAFRRWSGTAPSRLRRTGRE